MPSVFHACPGLHSLQKASTHTACCTNAALCIAAWGVVCACCCGCCACCTCRQVEIPASCFAFTAGLYLHARISAAAFAHAHAMHVWNTTVLLHSVPGLPSACYSFVYQGQHQALLLRVWFLPNSFCDSVLGWAGIPLCWTSAGV